ncbi:MAG: hypothetical protein J5I93_07355 [Pirellulaceae bacterium]|nr:hypothetical protein [Pirellulaceae bacterium]
MGNVLSPIPSGVSCLILVLVVCVAGCADRNVTHQARKPVVEFTGQPQFELGEILGVLRTERDQLGRAAAGIQERRQASLARLARALGDDYPKLLATDPGELSIYFAHVADQSTPAAVHARELARHAVHLDAVERRMVLLDATIAEAEGELRLLANYTSASASAEPPEHSSLLGKLLAVAHLRIELPAEQSSEEIAHYVTDQLTIERQDAQQRQQQQLAQQQARIREQQAAELAAALAESQRREAERLAWLEASRKRAAAETRASAERLAAEHAAMALKRYADAYHLFFQGRYRQSAELLDEAISLEGDDPRFHYYRGLARLRLGQSDLAQADFQAGGALERHGRYGVGQALERIQGPERGLIERFRR